ncbi:MAG: CBS domain-containing protein [Gammaproteobacteria bacterium]|nr:CBS domain-containing protein [Gammaproteobacteria bacterium]NIM72252.1 CBS domain-containing protein [Gammaproteobacteria bacterium]NIN39167.1 CBS domain-containing protein [Gammaproteobacteria bacterium]NIO24000.1 CBS domain-containing protein [Gammaproteobacteria bacterium]NIO64652.1 CBS domain-containing protein [Gammaproteobacteria bacterium]
MKARDIMTTKVVTVNPQTPVRDVAALMIQKHISGVPVLSDSGALVGLISEGDLLRRPEIGTEKHRRRWLSFFTRVDEQAREFAKSHALRAADVMTKQVVHVAEDTSLGDVVEMMEKHNVKRLPVLADGKLVGIVSRRDMLRALAWQAAPMPPPPEGDAAIRAIMNDVLKNEEWAMSAIVNVIVSEGVVHLWGVIDSDDQRRALRVAAENIPGVSAVEDHLTFSLPT